MSHQIEQRAERVACDLSQRNVRDAANVLRNELECDPREALALIQMANQMRDPRSPDHIVVQNGNVFIRDEQCRTQTYAGHLDFDRDYGRRDDYDRNRGYGRRDDCDRNRDYGRRDDYDRYPNRNYGRQEDDDPRFPNRTYDDSRYQQNRYDYGYGNQPCDNNNSSYYGNNRPYQNGNYYGDYRGQSNYDYPQVYNQPEIYQRPIYIPDCYGNGGGGYEGRGLNAGSIALLALGGYAIGRSISHHNGGNFSIRARF